jgi:hypothetical protein
MWNKRGEEIKSTAMIRCKNFVKSLYKVMQSAILLVREITGYNPRATQPLKMERRFYD